MSALAYFFAWLLPNVAMAVWDVVQRLGPEWPY
jgi:hypothetical protein